jgi:hypothetical protein
MLLGEVAFRRITRDTHIGKKKTKFLGAYEKLRKATVCFVKFVRLERLGFHWTDFLEI